MGYSVAVDSLYRLSDEEFRAIPPCDENLRQISGHRELGKIASKEQRWLYELCWAISPTPEESRQTNRAWPRYVPVRAIKKGGEAFLIETLDHWRLIDGRPTRIMLKVPLPLFKHEICETYEETQKQEKKIVKGPSGMHEVAKSLFRKLEPPSKRLARKKQEREFIARTKQEKEEDQRRKLQIARSVQYERFHRSFLIQETIHRTANRVDKERQYGYTPATFEFGFHPMCYFTQEFIYGQEYMDFVCTHSDDENFQLFLKMIIFMEKAVHSRSVAHCDFHTRNILVTEIDHGPIPVLLDYGIAKAYSLSQITQVGSVLGSADTASPGQMRDSRMRNYKDDIFAAGRILWTTIHRKLPPTDGIFVRRDSSGKLIYDEELEETLKKLFDGHALPQKYQNIYQMTQEETYNDITEFRADLEGLMFPDNTNVISCQEPCKWLLEEKRRNDLLLKAIKILSEE